MYSPIDMVRPCRVASTDAATVLVETRYYLWCPLRARAAGACGGAIQIARYQPPSFTNSDALTKYPASVDLSLVHFGD